MLDNGLKITVTFVGGGPQLEQAKAEARGLHFEKEAVFLGARTDVAELLPKYDLFLLHSKWEGFPISILEAMRAGLPVLASNVGGGKELVEHGRTGFLLEDDGDIDKYLRYGLSEQEKASEMGEAGRRRFLQNFLVKKMLKQIVIIYAKLRDET